MSPDTPDVTPPAAAVDAPASESPAMAGDAPPVPAKRARAPRKTAPKAGSAAAEGDLTTASVPADAAADAAVAPAPAAAPRKRTRKAVVAEEGTPAPAEEGPASGSPADVAASPAPVAAVEPLQPGPEAGESGPRPRVAHEEREDREERAGREGGTSQASGAGEGGGDADAEAPREADGEGGIDGEGEGEGRRSRNRRRRRGRRAGGAGEATEGAQGAQGPEGPEGPEGTPGDGDGEDERGAEGGPRPPRPFGAVIEFAEDAGETFAGVLSGAFDTEAEVVEGQPSIPAKRVLAAEPDAPKLHKVLAQSGIGSRRDMEQLITDGKVTVNGEVAHTGQRISFGDEVRVAGRVVKLRIAPPPARVIAYHKPAGEVVTMDDPEKRPTVFRRLPRLAHGKWQSVGRLDINTEGLLLFTNSGDLANKLMHPRFGVEREYAARVLGTLDEQARARLLEGVVIEGQPAQFKSIEDGGGEGANRWYRVVITEGRNREVRKLFDAVGMAVSRLIRIRYGSVVLPKGLKRGVWVDLDENDVRRLRQLAGAELPARAPADRPRESRDNRDNRENRDNRDNRDNRGDRNARGKAPPPKNRRERDRPSASASPAPVREPGDPANIPNPLLQTFDRRAMQQRERPVSVPDDFDEDGPIGPIPNPLQQTYDKRFVQGNRSPFGGKGGKGAPKGGGTPKQPDPLQTAVGYIGADAFIKKLHSRGGGGRGRR